MSHLNMVTQNIIEVCTHGKQYNRQILSMVNDTIQTLKNF